MWAEGTLSYSISTASRDQVPSRGNARGKAHFCARSRCTYGDQLTAGSQTAPLREPRTSGNPGSWRSQVKREPLGSIVSITIGYLGTGQKSPLLPTLTDCLLRHAGVTGRRECVPTLQSQNGSPKPVDSTLNKVF
jgi:hypothetical protein